MNFLADLHPMVVHFPIVLFIFYSIFQIISTFTENELISKFALICLSIGVISVIGAVLTGHQAEEFAIQKLGESAAAEMEALEAHETYATITAWFFVFVLALKIFWKKNTSSNLKKIILFFLAVIGIILIYQTGDLGGTLVYKFGIGTKLI